MDNIAIVGCGAVTELLYVPAIKQLMGQNPQLKVSAVADKNIESAKKTAHVFGTETKYFDDYRELFNDHGNAVIITLPNYLHAAVANEFLQKSINVFLEKPMAMTVNECSMLIKTAREKEIILGVNHFKRRYPSLRVIKQLLDDNLLGKMVKFSVYEGRKYDWPLASNWLFDSKINTGGALIHNGCHTIDLMTWILGEMEILDYRDDRIHGKGIETDCDISVKTKDGATGRIRMSFVTYLKNEHYYEFERGWISWKSDDVTGFELGFWDIPCVQKINLSPSGTLPPFASVKIPNGIFTFMECFADQVENFLKSTKKEAEAYVTGDDALHSIRFIEQCYDNKKPVMKTWKASPDLKFVEIDKAEKIAVLGASGFIGSALVQRLAEAEFTNVRPAVRSYTKGAAVCQTGYPIYLADIKDKQSLINLFTGCSTVYHCAVGDDDTIVSGITNCIEAAVSSNVKRIIYISTARVFGYDYSNVNDNSAPKPPDWNSYAKLKTNAEKIIEEARAKYAIDIRILRPCMVWGPNSSLWTMNICKKILSGHMTLLDEPQNVCNLVFIDNLIDILLLVNASKNASNANFNVSDHHVTWKEFIGSYCGMLGVPMEAIQSVSFEQANRSLQKDYIGMARTIFSEILNIQEVKDLILSLPYAKEYAVKRRQRLNRKEQQNIGQTESKPQNIDIDKSSFHLQNCKTVLSCDNLRTILQYQPRVDYQTAMDQTRKWLSFNGFIS